MDVKNWLMEQGLAALLWGYSQPIWVMRALAGRSYPQAASIEAGQVTVGLVQMSLELAESPGMFVEQLYPHVRSAVQQGAQFLVFPEYTGAALLGLLPGLAKMARTTTMAGAIEELAGGQPIQVADVFRAVAPTAQSIYVHAFAQLARRFNVYIVGGSLISLGPGGELYNTAHLFNPRGQVIGTQRKLHLYTTEDGLITPGDQLAVFSLPFGRLAMPVCMDYTYWETARLATLHGAEILVDVTADEAGDNEWLRARGVRLRVQESPAYGLHCFLIADIFGLHWRGRSSVFAPVELLPASQRTLAEARTVDQPEIVVAMLDLNALRSLRESNPLELNPQLYGRYLPGLYGGVIRDA